MRLYYISDIHLDYKIAKYKLKNEEVNNYIRKVADKIGNSLTVYDEVVNLVICGDTSSSIRHIKTFLSRITCYVNKVYFVCGNHELWKHDVSYYKKNINIPDVYVVENDVLLVNEDRIVPASEINTKIDGPAILFGVGYGGRNDSFNASYYCGFIYRDGLSRTSEIKRSKIFETCVHKLSYLTDKLYVATHFPPTDYLKQVPENIVFISGHTHENVFAKNYYAFSQVGYDRDVLTPPHSLTI